MPSSAISTTKREKTVVGSPMPTKRSAHKRAGSRIEPPAPLRKVRPALADRDANIEAVVYVYRNRQEEGRKDGRSRRPQKLTAKAQEMSGAVSDAAERD